MGVMENSPAAKAGIRGLRKDRTGTFLGDVIVKIGDYPIRRYADFLDAMDKVQVGETVEVTFIRDDKIGTVSVTLESNQRR